MGSAKALKDLILHHNHLEELPSSLGLYQLLSTLDVSDNDLTELPEDMRKFRNLQVLMIARNQLSQMPKSFKFLERLHTFDVTGNNYVTLIPPDNSGTVKDWFFDFVCHLYKLSVWSSKHYDVGRVYYIRYDLLNAESDWPPLGPRLNSSVILTIKEMFSCFDDQ